MAISIEQSTIGTDTSLVQTEILEKIKKELIEKAQEDATKNLGDLCTTTIPEIWGGKSAEAFVEKVKSDNTKFVQILDKLMERMDTDIKQMSQNVANADSQVGSHIREMIS